MRTRVATLRERHFSSRTFQRVHSYVPDQVVSLSVVSSDGRRADAFSPDREAKSVAGRVRSSACSIASVASCQASTAVPDHTQTGPPPRPPAADQRAGNTQSSGLPPSHDGSFLLHHRVVSGRAPSQLTPHAGRAASGIGTYRMHDESAQPRFEDARYRIPVRSLGLCENGASSTPSAAVERQRPGPGRTSVM